MPVTVRQAGYRESRLHVQSQIGKRCRFAESETMPRIPFRTQIDKLVGIDVAA
ncbi:MAG: hypothetical protein QOD99_2982, partial [Chthoniobacter sp.]|nr:hypothetical protein [Chthoniobacter sp.]